MGGGGVGTRRLMRSLYRLLCLCEYVQCAGYGCRLAFEIEGSGKWGYWLPFSTYLVRGLLYYSGDLVLYEESDNSLV